MTRIIALTLLILPLNLAIKIDDELELNLELIKHQPCAYKPGRILEKNISHAKIIIQKLIFYRFFKLIMPDFYTFYNEVFR